MDNKQKLRKATELLGRYFGLSFDPRQSEALSKVLLNNSTTDLSKQEISLNETTLNLVEYKLSDILMNTSNGAPTTTSIINKINDLLKGTAETSLNTEEKKNIHNLIQIYYANNPILEGTGINEKDNLPRIPINTILGYGEGQNGILNSNANSTSKTNPGLSVIVSNSMRVSLEQKNVNSTVIFLNGIPNIELARATPYVNVQLFFPRSPVSNDGRIQSLSLLKFLEGAKKLDLNNTSEKILVDGLRVKSSDITNSQAAIERSDGEYTIAGMEIFTSPQTLVNANTPQDYDVSTATKEYDSLRANPVLDKFRPFMTLNEIELSVVPTKGLMSYKSGTIKITLHDRSRLSEIAELIRADLYGLNEILIEYGWSHPDGEIISNQEEPYNAYGLFLDGLKVKEKYGIINSSFSFKENGEVEVSLKIAMRGSTAADTELVSSTSENAGNPMKELEELQKTITELRDKVFATQGASSKTKEIRPIQILDAAQDISSFLTLGSDLKKSLDQVRAQLSQAESGKSDISDAAKQLKQKLDELYGPALKQEKGKENKSGLIKKIKTSIIENIESKINKLSKSPDPWVVDGTKAFSMINDKGKTKGRLIDNKAWTTNAKNFQKKELGKEFKSLENGEVSLANLLLQFVGEPIANSKQYDEVQMIYYPFNANAGLANRINVANFLIDLPYFMNEFVRYRLENISKSGNMSVAQFLTFLQQVILDDPAAKSYGLHDENGAFYKTVTKDGKVQTESVDDLPKYNDRLNKLMKSYTHDGKWKQPQIKFYLESMSEEISLEDGISPSTSSGKTILRIHIFDQLATSYTSIQSLLNATRNTELEQIKSVNINPKPDEESGNAGVQITRDQSINRVIELASSRGFLENIGDENKKVYIIRGGSKELKRFIQSSMPYIIYGAAGTTIIRANLSSMQDPKLNTANLLRSFKKSELEPNGENPGGLPMRIIPTQLDIEMMGCPLMDFAQSYFIDFQTGTTADNIYAITGVTHKLSPGNFTTSVKFAPLDAYGTYQSTLEKISESIAVLSNVKSE